MDLYDSGILTDVITYISELGLDDIDSLQSLSTQDDDTLSDEELAMALFAEEAKGLLNIAKERVGHALDRARTIFEELEEMETTARLDRLVALSLASGSGTPPRPTFYSQTNLAESEPDDEEDDTSSSSLADQEHNIHSPPHMFLSSFLALTTPHQPRVDPSVVQVGAEEASDDSEVEEEDEETENTSYPPRNSSIPTRQCTICGDPIDGPIYETPCGHMFDMECLETMFRKATVDESLFPPRCCHLDIPISAVEIYLNSELVKLYNKKSVEFATPNRVYCHEPRCSAFIGSTTTAATILQCTECFGATCGFCKAKAHAGKECSDTDDLNSMAKVLNEKEGWQRCPRCHHMVELMIGCYHITCICSAQFCYLCTAKWKECSCPLFVTPPDLE